MTTEVTIKQDLKLAIEQYKSTRPDAFQRLIMVREPNVDQVVEIIYHQCLRAIKEDIEMTSAGYKVGVSLFNLINDEGLPNTKKSQARTLVQVGVAALGVFNEIQLVDKRAERQGKMTITYLQLMSPEGNPLMAILEEYNPEVEKIECDKLWTSPVASNGRMIVKRLSPDRKHLYTPEAMPMLYKSLNALHMANWSVDQRVLDTVVALEMFGHKFVPVKDTMIDIEEARNGVMIGDRKIIWHEQRKADWKMSRGTDRSIAKKVQRVNIKGRRKEELKDHLDILSNHGKRLDYEVTLDAAKKLQGKDLNFKYDLDSRGRTYTMATGLHPQSSDLAKALLMFTDGAEWDDDSLFWLMVHTANCCGQDKGSYEEMVEWSMVNVNNFVDLAEAPLMCDWWLEMEDEQKFQVLQASFAIYDYVNDVENTKCHINIGQDASQSGYQILSSMARDRRIATETNVKQHPDGRGDAYQMVGRTLIAKFIEDGHEWAKYNTKQLRIVTKRPTMVVPYGGGEGCIQDTIFDDRGKFKIDELKDINYSEARKIGTTMYASIKETFQLPTMLMDKFQDCVKTRINETDETLVSWQLPSGFVAYQKYSRTATDRTTCTFGRQSVKLSVQYDTDKPNKGKHKTSVAANVTHSLDASLMCLTICAMADKGITNFGMVHDSFGTDAGNVDEMRECFKSSFKTVCGHDRLNKIITSLSSGLVTDDDIEYGDLYVEDEELGDYIIS